MLFEKNKFFVPWSCKFGYGERKSILKLKHNYKEHQFCFDTEKLPYFGLINDNSTSKFFIDALINKNFDDAMSYVSKLSIFIDTDEIKKIFKDTKQFEYIIPIIYRNKYFPKGERINSVLISKKGKMSILHFYLINEPDSFSKWKIYRIEEEKVKRNFERKRLWIRF